jgi:hypothetical protein
LVIRQTFHAHVDTILGDRKGDWVTGSFAYVHAAFDPYSRRREEVAMAGKGDSTDPTWRYITLALARGRAYSLKQGHLCAGDSCCFVSSLALGLVIMTRNGLPKWTKGDGGPTLATDNRRCIELAYADHYLNMRASTGMWGTPGYASNWIATQGYDLVKLGITSMQDMGRVKVPNLIPDPTDPTSVLPDAVRTAMFIRAMFGVSVGAAGNRLEQMLRENPNVPLSAATEESIYWGNEGNFDGLADAQGSTMTNETAAMAQYALSQR